MSNHDVSIHLNRRVNVMVKIAVLAVLNKYCSWHSFQRSSAS